MVLRCVSRVAHFANWPASRCQVPLQKCVLLEASAVCFNSARHSSRTQFERMFTKKLQDNVMKNPKNMEDVQKLGLTQYLKKNRMYAQYNYQEWRYPQKERAIDISCTRMLFREYKEKDQMITRLKQPRKELDLQREEFQSKRQIKKRVPHFHPKRFPTEAQEIYVKAHGLLNTENWTLEKKQDTEEALHGLVTEFAYPGMLKGLELKTVKWEFVESLEPPQVVQVLCAPMVNEQNLYGQVTVRFNTKQILTIHDRFGRLMLGSKDVPREVLEYVTFERHISNLYGKWRIHAKKLAPSQRPEEMDKTIAIIRRKPERSMADEWHKQEEEECYYKWYPAREMVKTREEKLKRKSRGRKYWWRRRKHQVLNVKRTPITRMKRINMRRVGRKREEVIMMRKRGELPMPPE